MNWTISMIVSVSILRISRYRSDVGNFELNATLDGCGCEVLAWRWRSPEFVKVGWPHPVKFAWPHPGPSCVTKVVGCNGNAWGGVGGARAAAAAAAPRAGLAQPWGQPPHARRRLWRGGPD